MNKDDEIQTSCKAQAISRLMFSHEADDMSVKDGRRMFYLGGV
jgi:hypothetical protein